MRFLVLFLSLILDRLVGDPPALWQKIPHPVVIFGQAIAFCDRHLNRPDLTAKEKRRNGVITIVLLLIVSVVAGRLLHRLFHHAGMVGTFAEILIVFVLLAQKSLADHVLAVATALREGGLAEGRKAVSLIVGRDPDTLDESGVCRAALESLAENFSDGVVAPALWFAIAGLPGIFAYKMLNTADSMIGHKSEKYLHFGWASARLDDYANWPASRLSMLLIAAGALVTLGAKAAERAVSTGLADSGLHRSPNAGWPESALAGALDIQLAGPRVYGGVKVSEPRINGAGRETLNASDIDRGIALFHAACSALTVLAGLLALACL